MHHRRLAAFLLGAWIAVSLFMGYVATQNLFAIDEILGAPRPNSGKVFEKAGVDNVKLILKWHASEQNRRYFARWEVVQMILGVVLAAILFLGTNASRLMLLGCGAMVILVGFMHWFLTPEITWSGRQMDFLQREPGARFLALHGLYTGLEVLKLLIAAGLACYLFVFKSRPRLSEKTAKATI